ncbi:hypothetical protein OHA37_37570 [Streptomyces sp. NBC_00335]|uniref:hypothetical protein n=1 Tax=unclassified Streptomyces TaxID=2593676 RepID=UPI00224E2D22|nr:MULTISPECIES: hypothetical protein [unclassified Streptomyces]MCX5409555.1 hypothetical protein [Streptomyces sp. NBC_00086]
MAVLSTILLILGAWCAASLATVAAYAAIRRLHVRRQRAASAPVGAGAARGRAQRRRPRLPAHRSGRSGRSDPDRRVPPADLQAG